MAKPLADFTKSLPHLPSYPAEIFSWAKLSHILHLLGTGREQLMFVKMYNVLLVGNVTMGLIQCFCWKLNSQV